jgi:enoyl-CoA hydratase
MSRALLERLARLIGDLPASGAGAVVITGYDRFFSAGLDLPSLLPLDRGELGRFIELFGEVMLAVLDAPLPVVAAINGHAIAGGCVLALQADVRWMAAGGGKIGLTEVQLGIGLPAVVVETLRLRVAPAALRPIALEGRRFGPDEARAVGLVDEVVAAEELRARAVGKARELAELPAGAFRQIKAALAAPARAAIRAASGDTERWVASWFSPVGQERLRAAVAQLSR